MQINRLPTGEKMVSEIGEVRERNCEKIRVYNEDRDKKKKKNKKREKIYSPLFFWLLLITRLLLQRIVREDSLHDFFKIPSSLFLCHVSYRDEQKEKQFLNCAFWQHLTFLDKDIPSFCF